MHTQHIESTLCGAFIAFADYVQSPSTAFLMARLSAGHGNHAAYLGSLMKAQLYMANSTSLLLAFHPEKVISPGEGLGHLGQWMRDLNCTAVPSAPCGGRVEIGNLAADLTGI